MIKNHIININLLARGRLVEAEEALCWLRGWVAPVVVREEFSALVELHRKSMDSVMIIDSKQPMPVKEQRRSIWHAFALRTFYLPFSVVALAFFVGAFGGTITLQTFAVLIFQELKTPIDRYTAVVIMGAAQVVGTIICVFIIHFTGKRPITFVSIIGIALSLTFVATYGFLLKAEVITGDDYAWIPTTLVISAMFFSHVALKTLPWILAGEVFPPNVRSVATGASGSIGYIFSSIANKSFLYMVAGMSLSGTFVFYAIVNFAGCLGLYFMLPETEGRTLQEIEDHFAGIQDLKNKPDKEAAAAKEKWAMANPNMSLKDEDTRL